MKRTRATAAISMVLVSLPVFADVTEVRQGSCQQKAKAAVLEVAKTELGSDARVGDPMERSIERSNDDPYTYRFMAIYGERFYSILGVTTVKNRTDANGVLQCAIDGVKFAVR